MIKASCRNTALLLAFVFLHLSATSLKLWAQAPPQPALNSITPNDAPAGSTTPVILTLRGSNFTPQSAVNVDGQSIDTTFVDATTLTAVLIPSRFAGPTYLDVEVETQVQETSAESSVGSFLLYSLSPPAVTAIATNSGQSSATTGAQGASFTASITGTDLLGASISVNGSGVTVLYPHPVPSFPGQFVYTSDPTGAGNATGFGFLFEIDSSASIGARTIAITTPGGSTSTCGGQSCTFQVVDGGSRMQVAPVSAISPGNPAVVLPNGRVLVTGLYVNGLGTPATQSLLFDPSSNNWMSTGSLNTGRIGYGMTLLPDGRVLVVGGTKSNGTPTGSAEIYDPVIGIWSPAASMTGALSNVSAALLPNGRVAVSGQEGTDEYDPLSGTFLGTLIDSDARVYAQGSLSTLLLDGRVLVRKNVTPFCNGSINCQESIYSATTYSTTLANGVWTLTNPMPSSASINGPGLLLSNGQVLIFSTSGAFLYDPNSDFMLVVSSGYPIALLRDGRVLSTVAVYTPAQLAQPVPTISSITANSSSAGPVILTITGSNFRPNSQVNLAVQPLVSLFLGSGTLVAFVPINLLNSFDTSQITVTNAPPGGGAASLSGGVGTPAPTLTGLTPSVVSLGTQLNAVLIGTNLSAATSVTFSGTGVTATIQSGATATQLFLSIAIDPSAPLGPHSATVTTPSGSYTLNSALTLQTAPPTVPTTAPQPIPEVESGNVMSGYIVITPDAGSSAPVPTVTYGIIQGGAVQSQAGLMPTGLTTQASLFVEVIPGISRNVGVAVVNPGITNAVTFTLRDETGADVQTPVTVSLQPGQQVARFVSELFGSDVVGSGFRGTLAIQSSAPVGVMGLHFSGLQFSTVPISTTATVTGVPLRTLGGSSIGGASALIIPQFAMGGGWATQIALTNGGFSNLRGRIDILDTNGNPLPVKLNGSVQSTFRYSISAGGAFVLAPRDVNGQSPM